MKPRILIVEDEPGIADTIRYALGSEGFDPVWCATAEAGLAALDGDVALELGSDDYITKPFSPRELVARVRTILRRAQQRPAGGGAKPPATAMPLEIDAEKRRVRFYGRTLDLSRYEYGILTVLAGRPGRVYTRDELLDLVWDGDRDSYDRTVDAHVKTLRAKLRAIAPDVEPIVTHRGTGYALSEDLPPAPPPSSS